MDLKRKTYILFTKAYQLRIETADAMLDYHSSQKLKLKGDVPASKIFQGSIEKKSGNSKFSHDYFYELFMLSSTSDLIHILA